MSVGGELRPVKNCVYEANGNFGRNLADRRRGVVMRVPVSQFL